MLSSSSLDKLSNIVIYGSRIVIILISRLVCTNNAGYIYTLFNILA